MYARLTTICHIFPSISPFNVFDLQVDVWLMFAKAADEYSESIKESNANG